jgi:plastocyanin
MLVRSLALIIAGLLLLVACNGAPAGTPADTPAPPGTPPTGTPPPGTPPPAGDTPAPTPGNGDVSGEIDIVDFGYQPASYEVSAGTTVTWTNVGNAPHTVTFDDGNVDSGRLAAGEAFEHTFESEGTFEYLCTIHPQMRGTLTVAP